MEILVLAFLVIATGYIIATHDRKKQPPLSWLLGRFLPRLIFEGREGRLSGGGTPQLLVYTACAQMSSGFFIS